MSDIKCQECGTTKFVSQETWSICKDTRIDTEFPTWDSDIIDEDFRDADPFRCENGHEADMDVEEALNALIEKIRWD
jgi:hypothetical protein